MAQQCPSSPAARRIPPLILFSSSPTANKVYRKIDRNHQPLPAARCPPPHQPQEEEGEEEEEEDDDDTEMDETLAPSSLAGTVIHCQAAQPPPPCPQCPDVVCTNVCPVCPDCPACPACPSAGLMAVWVALLGGLFSSLLTAEGRALWVAVWVFLRARFPGWWASFRAWLAGWCQSVCRCCRRRRVRPADPENGDPPGSPAPPESDSAVAPADPADAAASTAPGTDPDPRGPPGQPRSSGVRRQVQPLGLNLGQAFVRPGKANADAKGKGKATGLVARAPRGFKMQ